MAEGWQYSLESFMRRVTETREVSPNLLPKSSCVIVECREDTIERELGDWKESEDFGFLSGVYTWFKDPIILKDGGFVKKLNGEMDTVAVWRYTKSLESDKEIDFCIDLIDANNGEPQRVCYVSDHLKSALFYGYSVIDSDPCQSPLIQGQCPIYHTFEDFFLSSQKQSGCDTRSIDMIANHKVITDILRQSHESYVSTKHIIQQYPFDDDDSHLSMDLCDLILDFVFCPHSSLGVLTGSLETNKKSERTYLCTLDFELCLARYWDCFELFSSDIENKSYSMAIPLGILGRVQKYFGHEILQDNRIEFDEMRQWLGRVPHCISMPMRQAYHAHYFRCNHESVAILPFESIMPQISEDSEDSSKDAHLFALGAQMEVYGCLSINLEDELPMELLLASEERVKKVERADGTVRVRPKLPMILETLVRPVVVVQPQKFGFPTRVNLTVNIYDDGSVKLNEGQLRILKLNRYQALKFATGADGCPVFYSYILRSPYSKTSKWSMPEFLSFIRSCSLDLFQT